VIISLTGIGAGVAALLGMAGNNRLEVWTVIFLVTTALTSITGFFFHSKAFGPPRVFGVITLVVMVPVLLARYSFRLRGWWRLVYIVGAVVVLWLNAVVGVIQFFQKAAFLQALAPTQTEPPFIITQLAVLGLLVVLGAIDAMRFQRQPRSPGTWEGGARTRAA